MSFLSGIRILYSTEMRAALRERTIVVNSILLPILLYPLLMWAAFNGILFVHGQTEGSTSRVAVTGWGVANAELERRLEKTAHVEIVEDVTDPAAAATLIREGALEAFVELLPAEGEARAFAGNFSARITYSASKERSAVAKERLDRWLSAHRDAWLEREATAGGIAARDWQVFSVQTENVASSRQVGAFILGLMIPLLFAAMVALGCFHPAIDATAGERERRTWETTMSLAVPRSALVVAKYLVVATFGFVAGALNLGAVTLTLGPIFEPIMRRAGERLDLSVPLAALPLMALAAVLLAAFVAGGMMVFAVFAKTFKEGQAMISPFYMLVIVPMMIVQVPGLEFSTPLALLPVANVALMVRDAIAGVYRLPQIALTVLASLGAIALVLWVATAVVKHEDVVIGSYKGTLASLLRQRLLGRGARAR